MSKMPGMGKAPKGFAMWDAKEDKAEMKPKGKKTPFGKKPAKSSAKRGGRGC